MYKIKAKDYGKMTGKLQGIRSISSSPVDNPFCLHMSKNPNTICSKCYSIKMIESGYRSRCRPAWQKMGELLADQILEKSEIKPCINTNCIRFNSHGEILNMNHLINLFTISEVNSHAICALFTKRSDLLRQLDNSLLTPGNLIIVYSNPLIDSPLAVEEVDKKGFRYSKIFNVFTKEYAMNKGISINCGGKKCKDCMVCYSQNNINVINELVK